MCVLPGCLIPEQAVALLLKDWYKIHGGKHKRSECAGKRSSPGGLVVETDRELQKEVRAFMRQPHYVDEPYDEYALSCPFAYNFTLHRTSHSY